MILIIPVSYTHLDVYKRQLSTPEWLLRYFPSSPSTHSSVDISYLTSVQGQFQPRAQCYGFLLPRSILAVLADTKLVIVRLCWLRTIGEGADRSTRYIKSNLLINTLMMFCFAFQYLTILC